MKRIATRSSEAGHILRKLLKGEGYNENISRVGMRNEIFHVFGMKPVTFTSALLDAIAAHGDDDRVRFFATTLNITGDAKGLTLEARRRNAAAGGSPSTWVRHEIAVAEILSDYLLQYRIDHPVGSDASVMLTDEYNPLEEVVARSKEENLRLQARIKELEAQIDQIHQLSSRL